MTEGRCLCGAVRFRTKGKLTGVEHCHCSMCRKHHGTAFASFATAEAVEWLSGSVALRGYRSSATSERRFCGTCSAKMPNDAPGGAVFVALGNLTEDPGVRPSFHIFAASKAPWHEITDDLPQHDELPAL